MNDNPNNDNEKILLPPEVDLAVGGEVETCFWGLTHADVKLKSEIKSLAAKMGITVSAAANYVLRYGLVALHNKAVLESYNKRPRTVG